MKSSDLHRILTPCRSIQITAFISEDKSISSCSHLRCSFSELTAKGSIIPSRSRAPHGPFYDLDPTPVARWRGATLLWWGPSLWSARPFVRGLWLLGRVRALWGAGAFVIHRKRKHQQVLNTAEHDTIKSNMGCKTAGDSDALIILFLERGASVIMRAVWTPSLRRQSSTCARN